MRQCEETRTNELTGSAGFEMWFLLTVEQHDVRSRKHGIKSTVCDLV